MKNTINYYYGIIVNGYKKRNSSFIFLAKQNEYEFVECYENINNLLNIYSLLKINGRNSDEIILNKNNEIITYYEQKPYILLKKYSSIVVDVTLDEIINYACVVHVENKLNWKSLWKDKLDYYEIQLEETGIKYNILKKSFNYYLGLSEIAINLLNFIDYKKINYYICHKRIENSNDLLNPLNMVIDNKMRDIAEYIKVKYINNEISVNQVIEFIGKNRFTNDEIILFFSRLIYPSYYFDIYEKIYYGSEDEKSINKVIKKNVYYETFLKDVYNILKFKYSIPQIEFLEH